MVKSGLTTLADNSADILDALDYLRNTKLMVGIPATNAPRQGEAASNAVIGYVMENGNPEKNIPARPFLIPGIGNIKDIIQQYMKAAGQAALSGERNQVKVLFNRLGLLAVSAVRKVIDNQGFAPLAESTLKARIAKLGVRARKDLAAALASGSTQMAQVAAGATDYLKILIDTGAMRNAITYVLRKNGQDES